MIYLCSYEYHDIEYTQTTTPASQQVASSPRNLFSILSHNETLEMFAMAKDGLKISPSIIDKLDI